MDDTEQYESRFDDSEVGIPPAKGDVPRQLKDAPKQLKDVPRQLKDVPQNLKDIKSESYVATMSGSHINIYRRKNPKRYDMPNPPEDVRYDESEVSEMYEVPETYEDCDIIEASGPPRENKNVPSCSSEMETPVSEDPVSEVPVCEVPVCEVPNCGALEYPANTNYGPIDVGTLVFIDTDGAARSVYNVPKPQSAHVFEGLRFIAASHSLGRFQMVRTMDVPQRSGTILTKAIFEQVDNDGEPITQIELADITNLNANFAVDSVGNRSWIVGNGFLWVVNRNNTIALRRRMPSMNTENVHVIAAREDGVVSGVALSSASGYTAGVFSVSESFHDVEFTKGLGYITRVNFNGTINQLIGAIASNLSFRGMYYFNDRLYVTVNYSGQLYITKHLSRNVQILKSNGQGPQGGKPDLTDVHTIAGRMPANASAILAFDGELNLVWWRVLVSNNPCHNIIGDITCNAINQVFTTCRFKGTLGLSEYNSVEIDSTISHDDEAIVIVGLTGEIRQCRTDTLPDGIGEKPLSWWRMIPVDLPPSTVSNYISLTNNGYDIIMSGYASVSLSDKYVVGNHYFIAAFTPKLFDLYYHPIVQSLNNYNSRIIAVSNRTLFTGSTAWSSLYVFPFGMLKEFPAQLGYFITFSLNIPNLVGIVTSKNKKTVNAQTRGGVGVQFTGITGAYPDAKVGKDYYISYTPTSATQPVLTNSNIGQSDQLNRFGTATYYGTAVRDGCILISRT